MRIAGFCVLGANEKHFDKALKSLERVCDFVYVVFNNVPEDQRNRLKLTYSTIDDREWGKYQPLIKEDAMRHIERLKPDWVLSLDSDEEFIGTRNELEELTRQNDSWYLYIVNLINDENHYTKEWSFFNCRFFKYQNINFRRQSLHCGSAPEWAFEIGNYSPLIIKHYGLMDKADRQRKVERYNKYDPDAIYKGRAYYDFIASNPTTEWYNEEKVREDLKKEISKYKQKRKSMSKKDNGKHVILLRLEDGAEVVIPERHKEITLSTGKFRYLSEYGAISKPEAEVIEKEEVLDNVLQCKECSFIAKSERGLQIHSKKHANHS